MLKITDKNYFLPTIEALQSLQILSSGRTKPVLITGVCTKTGIKSEYVVKFRRGSEMILQSSCSELVALFIARELDMNVVEPVLVNVSQAFVDTLKGSPSYEVATNSVGINYGCKFAGPGFLEFIKNQQLTDNQYTQAQQIFAFDVFISNSDRREDKQNMLTDGDKIVIFDHEMAFGFLLDIIKNTTPWIIRDIDRYWICKHYFYNLMKGSKFNFNTFVDNLETLNDGFWEKVYTLIPRDWKTENVDIIKSNLDSLVRNRSIFLQELNRVFS